MKKKLQTLCEKVEEEESSQMIAIKKLEEETEIKGLIMKYLGTNKQFNCNIYLYQLETEDTIEQTEPEKNSE